MPDLLIRGGRVVDGSGSEPVAADVVVDGDRIVAIGTASGHAARVIDADDAVVAPGFIDLHTHCDFTIHDHPDAPAAVHQGVTTLVAGNCGFSGYPVVDGSSARIAEWCAFLGARPELLAKDAQGRFASLGSLALAPNLVQLVGHGAIRLSVMGDDPRPATVRELDAMDGALREALEAGAAGLSSGLIYAPGSFAAPEELERLARTVALQGGIHAIHIRDEDAGVVRAAREAIALAEDTGAHVHISHLKSTSRRPGVAAALLAAVSGAREQGAQVSADQYPYTMSSTKLDAIPSMGGIDPEQVLIATDPSGRYTGRTLAELAADIGEDAMDAVRGLPGSIRDAAQVLLLDRMREEDVRQILASPTVAVASDGWTLAPAPGGNPHPRNFGTFARVLAHYTRTLDLLSLPIAIHKMTSLPARILGLGDRGRLAPGMVADVVVFDPGTILERATVLDPFAIALGMRHVLVAGEPIIQDGVSTGRRPGRVLRRLPHGWSG
jgi:N-acyl-D-amino-acid deacylase